MPIKTPFVEDLFGRHFPPSRKFVKRSFPDLQVVSELLDRHDGTGHFGFSSLGLMPQGTQKIYQFEISTVTEFIGLIPASLRLALPDKSEMRPNAGCQIVDTSCLLPSGKTRSDGTVRLGGNRPLRFIEASWGPQSS